jgi:peptide-methionine (S)-S-oxide reductase
MSLLDHGLQMPSEAEALPGRAEPMPVADRHFAKATPLRGSFLGMQRAMFGMGCFWGAERRFWLTEGVFSTAVGYAGGYTPNPSYQEVCSGLTGHAEVVRVIFDPEVTSYAAMLELFWENHDPTQGMRQGMDVGTQYRSAVYCYSEAQMRAAQDSRRAYQVLLTEAGYREITTEIQAAPEFYFAEDRHQQYLAKNPTGECGFGGTGVACPLGLKSSD